MAPFVPVSDCCLRVAVIPGEPRGEMQPAGSDGPDGPVRVGRYVTRPAGGVAPGREKTALVILYDIFGFSVPNAKILADQYADRLGVNVFVPDYLPNPVPASMADNAVEAYPGQLKDQAYFPWALGKLRMLRVIPYLPGILDWSAVPLVDKALEDLRAAGYTTLLGAGYCRGGSMIAHLLSKGDAAPIAAGVLFHPAAEPDRWPKFTHPSLWLVCEVDKKQWAEAKNALEKSGSQFETKMYTDVAHGFAARPAWEHAPTRAAFEDANGRAAEWLKARL